jgi:putative sulfotransferase
MTSNLSGPPSRDGALILCTGRCGSTVVADVLADHPDTMPLMEFFYAQFQTGIPEGTPTGEEFWSLLNRPWRSLNTMVSLGRVPAELRYKADDPANMPEMSGLLGFTLPAITDEPDKLLAQLGELVPEFPAQPAGAHYRRLFELLCELSGRDRWVEKSAGSCMHAAELGEMFPDAKMVYLVRDCVDVATSMTYHPMFQLAELRVELMFRAGVDPYVPEFTMPEEGFDPELDYLLPERLTTDTLDARAGSQDSLLRLAGMQAVMARKAEEALATKPEEQVLRMRYEDLLDNPYEELDRLGRFLELPEVEEWARRSAARIRRPERSRPELAPEQQNLMRSVYHSIRNAPQDPLEARAGGH